MLRKTLRLFESDNTDFISFTPFLRIVHKNGVYSLDNPVSYCGKNRNYFHLLKNDLASIDNIIDYKQVIDYHVVVYNNEPKVNSRQCNQTSWDKTVVWDGGDKRLRSKLET